MNITSEYEYTNNNNNHKKIVLISLLCYIKFMFTFCYGKWISHANYLDQIPCSHAVYALYMENVLSFGLCKQLQCVVDSEVPLSMEDERQEGTLAQ